MGLFGKGFGKKLGNKLGRLSEGLSVAAAQWAGEPGEAAQIQAFRAKARAEERDELAKQQELRERAAALIQQGVPPEQALILARTNAADQILAAPYKKDDDAFTRYMEAAGIDPNSEQGKQLYAQRAATMAMPPPNLIGSAETGYRWVQPPAPTLTAPTAPQMVPPPITDEDWNRGAPVGGAGSGQRGFRYRR